MKVFLFVILSILSLSSFAQGQLSENQKIIWNVIEKAWAGELGDWPIELSTDDYEGWGQDEALPQTLKSLDGTLKFWNKYSKLKKYRLKVASIIVNEDTAVANYYATEYRENTKGDLKRTVTAVTETLVYRDGKWKFLASSSWLPKLN